MSQCRSSAREGLYENSCAMRARPFNEGELVELRKPTRRGVVPIVFWGKSRLPGAGDRCPHKALNLMTVQPEADQPRGETSCGPTVRDPLIENRGASLWDHKIPRDRE